MASSENLSSLDAWPFRPSFPDTWISEAFARDTDALTKALQKSLCRETDLVGPTTTTVIPSPTFPVKPEPAGSAQASGSDPESAPKRSRNAIPSSGKITKRKSRATKRSPTTFITADPSNFRQMVQQVTGTRFGNPQLPVAPILKPEPQRVGSRMPGCLPTLDTSAFLLDHHQQMMAPAPQAAAQVAFAPPSECSGLDFETFSSFPTLESWRVV
ncbi:hypothetical protein ACLOJK_000183 [Asimina triloba]